jgi:UV DNA damage repair endonuclease
MRATVWTGTGISDSFETVSGLKQGSNLSGYLFAIFINHLQDNFEGGLCFKDLNIRVLMYADDIVLLASDSRQLQNIINRLDKYSSLWNLNVNLNKLKMIIFRKGGKFSKNENNFLLKAKLSKNINT